MLPDKAETAERQNHNSKALTVIIVRSFLFSARTQYMRYFCDMPTPGRKIATDRPRVVRVPSLLFCFRTTAHPNQPVVSGATPQNGDLLPLTLSGMMQRGQHPRQL